MLHFRESMKREIIRLVKMVINVLMKIQITLRRESNSSKVKITKEKTSQEPANHKFLKIEDKVKECKVETAPLVKKTCSINIVKKTLFQTDLLLSKGQSFQTRSKDRNLLKNISKK